MRNLPRASTTVVDADAGREPVELTAAIRVPVMRSSMWGRAGTAVACTIVTSLIRRLCEGESCCPTVGFGAIWDGCCACPARKQANPKNALRDNFEVALARIPLRLQ